MIGGKVRSKQGRCLAELLALCVLDVDKGCSKEEVASYCLYC